MSDTVYDVGGGAGGSDQVLICGMGREGLRWFASEMIWVSFALFDPSTNIPGQFGVRDQTQINAGHKHIVKSPDG